MSSGDFQQITKIKIKGDQIVINYEDIKDDDTASFRVVEYTSSGKPLPSFKQAMQAMMQDVIHFCCLEAESWDKGMVTAITIKYVTEGLGFTVTSMLVNDHAINISTPYIAPDYFGGETTERLYKVIDEAKKYINGARESKQLSIFGSLSVA